MENSWQSDASGSRGKYQVNYTPTIDLTAPYYQQNHDQHTHPHPYAQPYHQPPPHPYAQPYQQPPPRPCAQPYQHPPPHLYRQPSDQAPEQSSHEAQQGSADQVVVSQDNTLKRKKRDKNYLLLEDETLCSAWLNVSKDPIVGTSQGAEAFWARITSYFNEHKRTPIERSLNSLQHRWSDIKKETSLFTMFYGRVVRQQKSGQNEDDKIKEALQMYEGKFQGKQFRFLHCWLVLRHEYKWNEMVAESLGENTADSVRKETTTEGQPSVPETAPSRMERPMGRDRAKKQRSSGGGSNSTSCYEMLNKMQVDRANYQEYMRTVNKNECEAMSSRSDRKLELQERQLKLQEKMFELQEREREDRIMTMPLDNMEPWAREYILNQKKAIAAKSSARCSEQGSDEPHND